MTNPYAPPRAAVSDVSDPAAGQTPAGRGVRLAAVILDGVVVMFAVYVPISVGVVAAGLAGSGPPPAELPLELALGSGVALIGFVVWVVFTIMYVGANGQTIAKKWLSIKVVRADGSRASLGRIFLLRNILNIALSLIPLYGIIDSLFIFSESRQCLHDKIADTIVVNA